MHYSLKTVILFYTAFTANSTSTRPICHQDFIRLDFLSAPCLCALGHLTERLCLNGLSQSVEECLRGVYHSPIYLSAINISHPSTSVFFNSVMQHSVSSSISLSSRVMVNIGTNLFVLGELSVLVHR